MNFLENILIQPSNWFIQIINSSGTYTIFIGTIALVIAIRLLVYPLLKTNLTLGSDKVRKNRNNGE